MSQVENTLKAKLEAALQPVYLTVENESHGHSVAKGAETHFKVVMVSELFEGLMPVKRHQKIYAEVNEELQNGVHALALHLYTPAEWEKREGAPVSPNCMGGNKK